MRIPARRRMRLFPYWVVLLVCSGGPNAQAADSRIPLTPEIRKKVALLGEGVVGDPLPARAIKDPARLYHLRAGTWQYRMTYGTDLGKLQTVTVERVAGSDPGSTWKLEVGHKDIQQLRVTLQHEVEKLSQVDLASERLVVYRPALVLTPGIRPGETKSVKTHVTSYRTDSPDEREYKGLLDYQTTYVGAYRVNTPAGSFDARLLIHRYDMSIGPATVEYESLAFYADEVGKVAEVVSEKVRALFVYRRTSEAAKVLFKVPVFAR